MASPSAPDSLMPLGERGQTAGEYLGIIVVVATIVVVLTTTDVGAAIRDALTATIDRMVNG